MSTQTVFLEKLSYQLVTRERSGCLRMSDWINHIRCGLSSVPWEGCAAGAAAASPSPTPGYCHLLYQGRGETQVTWHGETYCLVGGYRSYGDAPVATPEKVEAEKPVPRRAPKRHATSASDQELGCPPPKLRRLQHRGKRLTPQKLAGHATCVRRARV
ncbi:DPEP2 neighbor protein-like [Manis pentadactyla]|uniref:DPEP2 neighbor protein-like n=1 Tax=Manis pentadactyla TaxID=143292 RepID=UPI00255C29A5|nr:DPEP2 neighbor protein-like [Manis pentadactyla]